MSITEVFDRAMDVDPQDSENPVKFEVVGAIELVNNTENLVIMVPAFIWCNLLDSTENIKYYFSKIYSNVCTVSFIILWKTSVLVTKVCYLKFAMLWFCEILWYLSKLRFCEIARDQMLVFQQCDFKNDEENASSSGLETAEVSEDDEPIVSEVLINKKWRFAGHFHDISLLLLQENS